MARHEVIRFSVNKGGIVHTLEELDDCHAIPDHSPQAQGRHAVSRLTKAKNKPLEPFLRGGWLFHSKPHHRNNAVLSERVYRHDSGKILVGTPRITVKFKPGATMASIQAIFRELNAQVLLRQRFARNLFQIRIPRKAKAIAVVKKLLRSEMCLYAIPELVHAMKGRADEATDPFLAAQWQWQKIHCLPVWRSGVQGQGIRVAVIDQGFNLHDQEFQSRINIAGYYREQIGSEAEFSPDPDLIPSDHHGTCCASLALARPGDGFGGCGAAPKADFFPITIWESGAAAFDTLARAIAYAANPTLENPNADPTAGAHIISCSIDASFLPRPDVEDAVKYAVKKGRGGKGCLIFYAVSNSSNPISSDPIASIPELVKVGRSTPDDVVYESGFGPELDFLAPGQRVPASRGPAPLDFVDGTSFATPIAAGVAALLLGKTPSLSWDELRARLRSTCDKVGGVEYDADGRNPYYGFGRVNASKACN